MADAITLRCSSVMNTFSLILDLRTRILYFSDSTIIICQRLVMFGVDTARILGTIGCP